MNCVLWYVPSTKPWSEARLIGTGPNVRCQVLGSGVRQGLVRTGSWEEAADTGLRCLLCLGACTECVAGTVWDHWLCPSRAVMGSARPQVLSRASCEVFIGTEGPHVALASLAGHLQVCPGVLMPPAPDNTRLAEAGAREKRVPVPEPGGQGLAGLAAGVCSFLWSRHRLPGPRDGSPKPCPEGV